MRYSDYLNFSFFQIKEFLVLYETLNYTKAAQECYVTQSTLSRNIQSMENALGIQLFIRSTVKVTPTPAAKALYENLKQNYADYEAAILNAYQIQECKIHPITIALNDGMDIMPELLPFIQEFLKKHPNFTIHFSRDFDYTITKKLEKREIDAAIDFTGVGTGSFIECMPLIRGPLMLYFLKSNPLCRKSVLELSDLGTQQLLIRSPSVGSNQLDFMRKLLTPLHIEPRFSPFVANALDLSLNIQHDDQAILADGYYIGRSSPYLESRIIRETESVLYLKWVSSGTEISNVQILVKAMLEYFSNMLAE